jgi:hypothetical protein
MGVIWVITAEGLLVFKFWEGVQQVAYAAVHYPVSVDQFNQNCGISAKFYCDFEV